MAGTRVKVLAVVVALAAIALIVPHTSSFVILLATRALAFSILVMSLDILLGYTGLASLGQAAYLGIGAYTTAILATRYQFGLGYDFWLVIVLGMLGGALLAVLFGLLAIRATGVYFLMITLALGQCVWGLAYRWNSLTGGDNGINLRQRPNIGIDLGNDRLCRRRGGRGLRDRRDDRDVIELLQRARTPPGLRRAPGEDHHRRAVHVRRRQRAHAIRHPGPRGQRGTPEPARHLRPSLGRERRRLLVPHVDEPQAGSPAAKAGIVSGDVITAIDGVPVKDSRDLARKIGMTGPGTSVKLSLRHKGEAKTVTVLLAETPDARQAKADAGSDAATNGVPHLGLTLAPKKDDVGANNPGVAVVDVDPNGPAAERGVKIGDIILDVGGNTVANVADVKKALTDAQAAGKKSVLMRVKTADATHFVALPIA